MSIRDIKKSRRQSLSKLETSRTIVRCVMVGIDTTTSPDVTGRDGFVWVKEWNQDTGAFQAFNPYVQSRIGLTVLVASEPKPPYRRMVIDVDWGTLLDNNVFATGAPYLPAHHEDHEFPDNFPGPDVVYVYPRAITTLRLYSVSGLIISINPGYYVYQNDVVPFIPINFDLTAYLPAIPGNSKRILIYIDPVTNATTVLDGIEVVDPTEPLYPDALPLTLPIAWIKLSEGQTTIPESKITDARAFLSVGVNTGGIGSFTDGSVPFALGGTLTEDNDDFFFRQVTSQLIVGGNVIPEVAPGVPVTSAYINGYNPAGSAGNSLIAYAGVPLYSGIRANGSTGAESGILLNDVVLQLSTVGYGATNWQATRATIKAIATENWTDAARGLKWKHSATPTGTSTEVTGLEVSGERVSILNLANVGPANALTISGGAITVTSSYHKLTGEGSADDTLSTINGGSDGDILLLRPNSAGIITIDLLGNIQLMVGFSTVVLTNLQDQILLQYHGDLSKWVEITDSVSIGQSVGSALFLHEEAADVATYQQILYSPADDAENTMTAAGVVNGGGEVLMKAFITYPTTGVGVTLIEGGAWHFVTWAEVNLAAQVTDIVIRVYKRTALSVETELFNAVICPDLTTAVVQYETDTVQPDFIIAATDRLVFKYFAKSTSAVAKTVTAYYEGTARYSHIHTPEITLGSGVSGSGTVGRLAEWTAGRTIGDSTLIKSGAGVLTLSSAGAFTLTVPATGTAALGTGTSTRLTYWSGTNTVASAALITYNAAASNPILTIAGVDGTKDAISISGTVHRPFTISATCVMPSTGDFAMSFVTSISPVGPFNNINGNNFASYVSAGADNHTFHIGNIFQSGISGTYAGVLAIVATAYIKAPADTSAGSITNTYTLYVEQPTVGTGSNIAVVIEGGLVLCNANRVPTGDFIIHGDTVDNVFFFDASADSIGIGGAPNRYFDIIRNTALTNTVDYALRVNHRTSGTSAAGFGVGIEFLLERETGAAIITGSIESIMTTTGASWLSDVVIKAADSGASREGIRVKGMGSAVGLGFFGVAPVVRPTALTTALTTVTFTAPGTPDYAIAAMTNPGFGFTTQDEGHTVLSVIANLQARVNELETKLQSLGLLT